MDVFSPCERVREWVSAHRDGEAPDDPSARSHIATCPKCADWQASVDRITRAARVRPYIPPPGLVDAARTAFPRSDGSARRERRVARALLVLAGLSGLLLAAAAAMGLGSGAAPSHLTLELHALEAALSVGLLLAAADPDRYARPLLPLVVAAAGLTLLPATGALATQVDVVEEASHLSVLLGLVGLVLVALRPRAAGSATA